MTGHPFAYPADAAGHVLHFTWPSGHGHRRHAACTGCSWTIEAPGREYIPSRKAHTDAHAHLFTGSAA